MKHDDVLPPLRVERALRLLPEIEGVLPLRALLVSTSRPDERTEWSSSGPYLTLGKRGVRPDELRRKLPAALQRVTAHLDALYHAYLEALDCEQRQDGAGAVAAVLKAGLLEERVGRLTQARAWYDVALTVAAALPNRRPETDTLRAIGRLSLTLGRPPEAARHFQRALALAEAEFDQTGAIAACQGVGDAAMEQGHWEGAQAWFARGLRLAEAAEATLEIGRLQHRLGRLVWKRGDRTAAVDHVRRARECFEAAADANEMALVLSTQGQLDAEQGRTGTAVAAYREALAWARRASEHEGGLEVTIRLNLARLLFETDRLLEAEEEIRRAEQLAILGNLVGRLIQTYVLMGQLRGRQNDPTGFVFFEQAIELCRTLERSPMVEARVYESYGAFKRDLGEREEAQSYLERARDILKAVGGAAELERVTAELQGLTA